MTNPETIPTDPRERSAWVQYQLRLRGSSFSAIARQHGWSARAVAQAMRMPSFPQEKAIADALNMPIRQLFPERYDDAGQRFHQVRNPKDSSRSGRGNVKGSEAA